MSEDIEPHFHRTKRLTNYKLSLYFKTFPSKKNQKSIVFNKTTRRPFIMSSPDYIAWEKEALIHALNWKVEQSKKHGLKFPMGKVSASLIFYFPNKRRLDLSNKCEGIFDLLVKANIIEDDNWAILNPITIEGRLSKTEPRCEIYLSHKS